jgi:uncharacterized membrane protein
MVFNNFLTECIKKKNLFYFFVIFFFIFFILSNIKIYNLRSNYYDLGFYLNYYLNLINNNFDYVFNSNYQLISFLIYPFLKILPLYYWSYFLIFFQSLCVSLPIFFLKDRILYICVYLLSAPLWFAVLTDFHPDVLIIPIIFYINKLTDANKINIKIFFLLLIILLIKFVYIFLVIGYLLYFYINRYRFDKIYIFSFFIFFLVYLFLFFSNVKVSTSNNIIELFYQIFTINNFFNIIASKNALITTLVLLSSCSFLVFNNWKKTIIILPLILFYFILPSESYKKYYYHYYLPIFPIFIIIFIDTFDSFVQKYTNLYIKFLLLIIPLISNFIFSVSPISYSFLFSYKWAFEYKAYLIDNSISLSRFKLNELLISQSRNRKINVMIENNVFFSELINDNIIIKIFPDNSEFKNYDFILLKSTYPHFINDTICEAKYLFNCSNYDFINKYEKYLKKINQNFFQVYRDNNIIIFKNVQIR